MEKHYVFSAPGRTEIAGNHTDHQCGCVLAAAVDLETTAEVWLNHTDHIWIQSKGYPAFRIDLNDLSVHEEEKNTTAALVRGVASAFVQRGARLEGFDALIDSTVLPGSGLSSSAAFEVLIGTILNELFFEKKLTPIEVAQIGQYAENIYFGKPCGLMDQMASAVGGLVFIDFENPEQPYVEKLDIELEKAGFALCIIDSGADHADLTDEYAAVPREMKQAAAFFGKENLRQVPEKEFMSAIPALRKKVSDRAILRAMHIYQENRRVLWQRNTLKNRNMEAFLELVRESGRSSWMYLQNVTPSGSVAHQEMALALALCESLLGDRGAFRVHGGGFAGTIQAYVPLGIVDQFRDRMEAVLGKGSCHILNIRKNGGIRIQ